MAQDLCFKSASDLAEEMRAGRLSPVTVVDAYLERIDARNPTINAFVTVIADSAREAAREAEEAIDNGDPVGPLHGVPVAIKDFFGFKKGVRHTFGSRAFAEFVPDTDALFVERLEAAGAIVLGKTNTPEFARKGTTYNPLFGTTLNPFDPEKTPSGSSGGSAAAVADGMAALGQGSDVAGSIRAPASACGIFGFKPSPGRVPYRFGPNAFLGHTPYFDIGPLTRTVEDAALMLSVMAGPHPKAPLSAPDNGISYREAVHRPFGERTIAVSPDLGLFPIDERVRSVFEEAVERFRGFAAVDRVDPAIGHDLETIHHAFLVALQALSTEFDECFADAYGIEVLGKDRERVTDYVAERSEIARRLTALEYTHADVIRTGVYDAVQAVLGEYDFLVVPTLSVPPFDADSAGPTEVNGQPIDRFHGWMLTWPFNMTGHPVASIPIGLTDDGLPIGAQIVGRRFADDDVLTASAAFEREAPWAGTYPPG